MCNDGNSSRYIHTTQVLVGGAEPPDIAYSPLIKIKFPPILSLALSVFFHDSISCDKGFEELV